MLKLHFEIDKTIKTKFLKTEILKKYKNYSINQSNVIVVVGGDGFMLKTLKKYQKFKKSFYGINKGTYGFLMNKFKINNLKKIISRAKEIKISPLEMKVFTKDNKNFKAIAVNEVSLLRQSKQTASLQILNKKNVLIKKLVSDGVLISTPAGSTAYNLSVHGPILSIDSKKLAVTPISPFRPRRWTGRIVSSSSIITIKNLDIKKRPVSVVADNLEVRNIKSVRVKINKLIKFSLLYDKGNTLIKKIKLEQFKKK
tara:strand:+ start:51 stop:815 length:765 start_codon:yes stop_codon:yes gene_type:complete